MPFEHPIEGTYNGYTIKKGDNHASGRVLLPKDGNTLKFDAVFLPSVWHESKDSSIHKLYGFTDVNSNVHKNSARFGWRCSNRGKIDIFAYWYSDGKFGYKWVGETITDSENRYEIKAEGNYYTFVFNEKTFKTKRVKNIERGIRTRLYPYFEDSKGKGAPHEMVFYIYEYN